jgi:hypothetical protein
VYIRAWSSTRVATRAIPLTILIAFLVYIHIPIVFNIYIVPTTHKPVCHPAGPPGPYRKVFSLFNLIVFGFAPSFCMLVFGMFTLRHIREKKGFQIISTTNSKKSKTKTSERQLVRMLLAQVLVYSITGLTFSIALIIIATNKNHQKSVLTIARENLIIAIVGMLSNTGPCSSFYLFTLSSRLFRKELKKLFNRNAENGIQSSAGQTSTGNALDEQNRNQGDPVVLFVEKHYICTIYQRNRTNFVTSNK